MRQYLIAERIADDRGISYDRELLLCASFLHDAGLYDAASTGDRAVSLAILARSCCCSSADRRRTFGRGGLSDQFRRQRIG